MLVTNLAYDFFDQVFNCDQAGNSAVLVDHDGHADIVLLHLAQQITAEFAFRYEVHIPTHQRVYCAGLRLDIRHLQDVLGKDNPYNVVNCALEHRHARERPGAQQFDELFNRRVGGHRNNFRPGFHRFPYCLFAELHHRLDQVAIALVQNSFLLPSFQ